MRSFVCLALLIIVFLICDCQSRSYSIFTSFRQFNRGGGQDNATKETDSSSFEVSRKMYNKQASNWVRTEPRCLSDFTGRPIVFKMLAESLVDNPLRSITVLDVGCGEGYCARKAIELGASKVIGSDISVEMINSAKATAKGDERLKFFSAPCVELLQKMKEHHEYLGIEKCSEESVDIAIAVFLFNYLTTTEMEETMLQLYTALKPGGDFIFSVPHPSMIMFDHDKNAVFQFNSEGKGYFSSRNEKLFGQISTIDGSKLNIMNVHKTLNDYIHSISAAGFQIIDIQEAGVTEKHLVTNRDFFQSVKDRPLHLIFKLRKP